MLFVTKQKMCEVDGVYTKGDEDCNVFSIEGYRLSVRSSDDVTCGEYVAISKKLGSLGAKKMIDDYMLEFLEMHGNKLDFRKVEEVDSRVLCLMVDYNKLKQGDFGYTRHHMIDYLYKDGRFAKHLLGKTFKMFGDVVFITVSYNYDKANKTVEYSANLSDLIIKFGVYDEDEFNRLRKTILTRVGLYNKVFGLDEVDGLKVVLK